MDAKEIVELIISNTACQYSDQWKPDVVYTKEELIKILESYATEQSKVSELPTDEEIRETVRKFSDSRPKIDEESCIAFYTWMRGIKQEDWISVEDKPIKDGDSGVFLVPVHNPANCFMYWDYIAGYIDDETGEIMFTSSDPVGWDKDAITHWQPLPEPPSN